VEEGLVLTSRRFRSCPRNQNSAVDTWPASHLSRRLALGRSGTWKAGSSGQARGCGPNRDARRRRSLMPEGLRGITLPLTPHPDAKDHINRQRRAFTDCT